MTSTQQTRRGGNVILFPGKLTKESTNQLASPHASAAAEINTVPKTGKLSGVSQCVVDGLFGKRHWATAWVTGLCEADPLFLLHLIDQPTDYVHFICLVRLALLEQSLGGKNANEYAREYAHLIRTQSKRRLLKDLHPSCPAGILGVLPKLAKKPLLAEEYRQLIRSLADKDTRKYLCHARRVRKLDIHLVAMMESLPEIFRCAAIMRCIDKSEDYDHLRLLIKSAQLLDIQITRREINEVAGRMKDMQDLASWFVRKFSKVPFPPPPWEGTDTIQPVRSQHELKVVAERFKNCVAGYVCKVALGYSYVYVCERTPAVIEVKSDIFFGWLLSDIEGVKHKEITRVQKNEIIQAFSDAGFCNALEHHPRGHGDFWDMIACY